MFISSQLIINKNNFMAFGEPKMEPTEVSPEAPEEMEAARNQAAAEVEADDPELAKAIKRAELSTWKRLLNAARKSIEIEK
jgi:hypothetical protein